jgi:hypothetical protein
LAPDLIINKFTAVTWNLAQKVCLFDLEQLPRRKMWQRHSLLQFTADSKFERLVKVANLTFIKLIVAKRESIKLSL